MVNTTGQLHANYYLKPLSVAVMAYVAGTLVATWVTGIKGFSSGHSDFRAYYAAAYMVRKGMVRDLYNYQIEHKVQDELVSREEIPMPYIHPAFESLPFVPLSFVPFRTAYYLYLAFNILVLAITFLLLRRHVTRIQTVYPWLPGALFLTFIPVTATLIQGQDSVILLFLLTLAFREMDSGKELGAGLCIGLGAFRFQIILPMAVLFLLWRRWRVVTGVVFSGGMAALVSILMAGGVMPYVKAVARMSVALNSQEAVYQMGVRVSKMPNLEGLTFLLLGGGSLNHVVTAICSLALLAIAARATRHRLMAAIVAAQLVSYYSFIQDMTVLLLPIVLSMDSSIAFESVRGHRSEKLLFRASALAFVTPVLLGFIPDHFGFAAVGITVFYVAVMFNSLDAQPARIT